MGFLTTQEMVDFVRFASTMRPRASEPYSASVLPDFPPFPVSANQLRILRKIPCPASACIHTSLWLLPDDENLPKCRQNHRGWATGGNERAIHH